MLSIPNQAWCEAIIFKGLTDATNDTLQTVKLTIKNLINKSLNLTYKLEDFTAMGTEDTINSSANYHIKSPNRLLQYYTHKPLVVNRAHTFFDAFDANFITCEICRLSQAGNGISRSTYKDGSWWGKGKENKYNSEQTY